MHVTHRSAVNRSVTLALCGALLLVLIIGGSFLGITYVHAAGNVYYVATTGSDSTTGTSVGNAFQHIQKCASVVQAGDTCLIESGTYHETVTPTNSGTSSAPITYKPDTGATVVIDSADPVTGWTLYSGNIYKATVTLPIAGPQDTGFLANQVFVGSQMMTEARWPNTGSDLLSPSWATMQSGTTATTIIDSTIPAIDWTGAIVHTWAGSDPFGHQTGTVTNSNNGQITLSINTAGSVCPYLCPQTGGYYYLQGKLAALDSANEWYYDGTNHYLYLRAPNDANPASLTVEAKQRTNAFNLSGHSYTTIQGLLLFASTILTDAASQNVVLDGLTATYPSHFTTIPGSGFSILAAHSQDTGIILAGTYDTIRNSIISNSAGNGIFLGGNHNTATNNLIHDVDYMGTYASGLQWYANNSTITHNTIYRTGQDGITYDWNNGGANANTTGTQQGQNSDISYNDVYQNLLLTTDKGGIDICCSVDGTGTQIHHNWFHDIVLHDPVNFGVAAGIYPDNSSNHFTIHHNVVWNTPEGLRLNGSGGSYNHVYNNTLVSPIAINTYDPPSTGIEIKNNIFRGTNGLTSGTQSNNLASSSDPLFQDPSSANYTLRANSPAIDAGQVISGITDGYVGAAPDIGAYEYNGANWVAGCSLAACAAPATSALTTIDDSVSGSGQNQFNYVGSGWAHCSSSCGGTAYYNNTLSYDATANDYATLAFTGTQVQLYVGKWSNASGVAAISIDGGTETNVDLNTPGSSLGNQLVWTSPTLVAGNHILKVRVTGTNGSGSSYAYVPIDRVDIIS